MRRSGKLAALLALLALIALAAFGAVGAAAEDDDPVAKPPLFNGITNFQTIDGPENPELYFWEVHLQEEQELVQVDERHAEIVFAGEHRMGFIGAEQARDATGAEVPTRLAVIAPNIVSLTVHHRAGNPAAGGAPFRYPVTAGPPFTVGNSTVTFEMPSGEQGPAPVRQCVVPSLSGRTLAASRTKLTTAGCKLGAVRGKHGKGTKVVKQFRAPGTALAAGARVAIKLG